MRLEAKDVNISISGKPIVQHLSIEVPDRKFSALLGANGSGKTTLLRSIYRTQKMDSGIVRLDDEDITHFSGKKLARNILPPKSWASSHSVHLENALPPAYTSGSAWPLIPEALYKSDPPWLP